MPVNTMLYRHSISFESLLCRLTVSKVWTHYANHPTLFCRDVRFNDAELKYMIVKYTTPVFIN